MKKESLTTKIESLKRDKNQYCNALVQHGAILEAIDMIVTYGEEPSDFMMSFPSVRKVWDLRDERDRHRKELSILDEKIIEETGI